MWREATESEKSRVIAYGKAYGKRKYHIALFVLAIVTIIIMFAIPPALYSKEADEAFTRAAGFTRHAKSADVIKRMTEVHMDEYVDENPDIFDTAYAYSTELLRYQETAEEEFIAKRGAGNKAAKEVYKKAYLPDAIVLGVAILIGLLLQCINNGKLKQVKNDKFKVRDVVVSDKMTRRYRNQAPLYVVCLDDETDGYLVPHEIYNNTRVGGQALLLKIEGYNAWNDAYDIIP